MRWLGLGMVCILLVVAMMLHGISKRMECEDKGGVLLAGGGFYGKDVCLIGYEKVLPSRKRDSDV